MHQEEGYALMGAAFEVYNQLGYGMAEEIYQQSLEIELSLRGIQFEAKRELVTFYKGHQLETRFKPDLFISGVILFISGVIIVEIKAVTELVPDHEAQLFNYLRITETPIGYLINFGHQGTLQWKRFIVSDLKMQKKWEH